MFCKFLAYSGELFIASTTLGSIVTSAPLIKLNTFPVYRFLTITLILFLSLSNSSTRSTSYSSWFPLILMRTIFESRSTNSPYPTCLAISRNATSSGLAPASWRDELPCLSLRLSWTTSWQMLTHLQKLEMMSPNPSVD